MKFNVGEWVLKPGVSTHNCEQIRQVVLNEDKTLLHLYAVTYRADYRGLDGPSLEVDITAPQPGILRTRQQKNG